MRLMRSWLLDTLLAPLTFCPKPLRGMVASACLAGLDRSMPDWRETARRNLQRAGFPEVEKIVEECYRHYRRMMSCFFWQHTLDRRQLEQIVRVEGVGHIRRRRGRGVLFVTTHYGNWELCGYAIGVLQGPMLVPVQRFGYAWLDALLHRSRVGSGNRIISSRGAAPQMLAHLKSGGDAGMLIDTRPDGEARVNVKFLSLPGLAGTTAARLRRATGAEIVCAQMPWSEAEGRYVLQFHPAPPLSGDVAGDTQALLAHYDAIIRKDPGQYLWIHDRWAEPKPATGGGA